MGGRRAVGVLVAVGQVLSLTGAAARAEEPSRPQAPQAALVRACASSPLSSLPQLGNGLCKSLDSVAVIQAVACGHLPVDPPICAELTDGRVIDPAAVSTFEHGWVPRALRLQGLLDEDQPIADELIPHTHNSFNAAQYGPSLTTSDPNQRYTMTDQLRMGIRAIEMDVHWLPHPTGSLADGTNTVVLCHGETTQVGPLSLHVGCTVDRPLGPGLDELAAFLHAPGNEREVVFLYLQNELDGNPTAHAATIKAIQDRLGPLVERPTGVAPGRCQDLPVQRSRADLLAAGHRVILMGNCGPGAWSSWVFQRGTGWDEHGNSTPYPVSAAGCAADRKARGYDDHLIRITEDSTWLSAISGSPAPITEPEVRAMVRCGVDWIGLDRIGPNDPRLAALVWSWAPDEPTLAGSCAAFGADARFRAAPCGGTRQVACRTSGGGWVVPPTAVTWQDAFAACRAVGVTFEVPRSGWQAEQLRQRAPAASNGLWLDLAFTADGWRPGLASAAGVVPQVR
jgi:hypothetical protein